MKEMECRLAERASRPPELSLDVRSQARQGHSVFGLVHQPNPGGRQCLREGLLGPRSASSAATVDLSSFQDDEMFAPGSLAGDAARRRPCGAFFPVSDLRRCLRTYTIQLRQAALERSTRAN